jgi:hypothetical protein
MANQKITIDSTLVKGDKWYNMDINGKKAGISVEGAPKTIAAINAGSIEVEVNLIEKDGKYYVWDKQEQKAGGFKQLTPEQLAAKQQREDHTQRMIVAQNSVTNAVQYYQQRQGDVNSVKVLAKEFYSLVMELSK